MSAFASQEIRWPSLIRGDAMFLAAMGGIGLAADFASFAFGAGPFGSTFQADPLVIGVVEAHGLALLTAVAAWCSAQGSATRYWYWHLSLTHLLLGTANIAFFEVFVNIGASAGGAVITALHIGIAGVMAANAIRQGSTLERISGQGPA